MHLIANVAFRKYAWIRMRATARNPSMFVRTRMTKARTAPNPTVKRDMQMPYAFLLFFGALRFRKAIILPYQTTGWMATGGSPIRRSIATAVKRTQNNSE